jgi:hypothetical protein
MPVVDLRTSSVEYSLIYHEEKIRAAKSGGTKQYGWKFLRVENRETPDPPNAVQNAGFYRLIPEHRGIC